MGEMLNFIISEREFDKVVSSIESRADVLENNFKECFNIYQNKQKSQIEKLQKQLLEKDKEIAKLKKFENELNDKDAIIKILLQQIEETKQQQSPSLADPQSLPPPKEEWLRGGRGQQII